MASRELAIAAAAGTAPGEDWLQAARRARLLSWISLAWMGAGGASAVTAGVLAGSIALIGFGIDSAIEGFASLVIVWRFTGGRLVSEAAELRAQRLVAVQFFLLAPYVTAEALHALVAGSRPEASWLGVGLAASSVAGMPALGLAKRRPAHRLPAPAAPGEGTQKLLSGYPALALLVR